MLKKNNWGRGHKTPDFANLGMIIMKNYRMFGGGAIKLVSWVGTVEKLGI